MDKIMSKDSGPYRGSSSKMSSFKIPKLSSSHARNLPVKQTLKPCSEFHREKFSWYKDNAQQPNSRDGSNSSSSSSRSSGSQNHSSSSRHHHEKDLKKKKHHSKDRHHHKHSSSSSRKSHGPKQSSDMKLFPSAVREKASSTKSLNRDAEIVPSLPCEPKSSSSPPPRERLEKKTDSKAILSSSGRNPSSDNGKSSPPPPPRERLEKKTDSKAIISSSGRDPSSDIGKSSPSQPATTSTAIFLDDEPSQQQTPVQNCSPGTPESLSGNQRHSNDPSTTPCPPSLSSSPSSQIEENFSSPQIAAAAIPNSSQQQQQTATLFLVPNLPPPKQPQQVYVDIPRTLEVASAPPVTKVDIFPVLSFNDVPRFDLDMPDSPSGIRTFINILKGHRVYFHVVDSQVWSTNIERHYAEAQKCNPINYDRLDWAKVERRLSLRPTSDRHNEDLRLVHRWDNAYLVKKYFTFGLRIPEAGTSHVVQTSAAPVLFYELDSSSNKKRFSQHRDDIRRKKKKFSRTAAADDDDDVKPKDFSSYDQYLYERYVLQPFSIYRVPAGMGYVLLSYQKTLFRVDVVPDTVADDMEYRGVYRFASPTSDRTAKPNTSKGYAVSYNHPPPTPIALPPSSSGNVCYEQQQQQQPEEHYSASEEQQLLQQLLGSYEELAQQQQQAAAAAVVIPETLPNISMPCITTNEVTSETERLTLYATAATSAAEQQQQQYTLYLQPQFEQQQQQAQITQPPKPETRDAAVNTDSSLLECKNCSASSVSSETVAVTATTRGLGIAKKRISSCSTDEEREPSKKRKLEAMPLDLSRDDGHCGPHEDSQKPLCNLPPAPQKSFEDSGVFKSSAESSDEEGSSGEEEEEDEEEEERRSSCSSEDEQDHGIDEISLQTEEEMPTEAVADEDVSMTEEDAAVASITPDEEFWKNFV